MIFATLRGFNCLPLFIIPRVSVRPQRLLGTFLLSSLQFGAQHCSELTHPKEEIRKAAMYGANEVPSLVAFQFGRARTQDSNALDPEETGNAFPYRVKLREAAKSSSQLSANVDSVCVVV